MKTIKQWFEESNELWTKEALMWTDEDKFSFTTQSLHAALENAFSWEYSYQGGDYWNAIYERVCAESNKRYTDVYTSYKFPFLQALKEVEDEMFLTADDDNIAVIKAQLPPTVDLKWIPTSNPPTHSDDVLCWNGHHGLPYIGYYNIQCKIWYRVTSLVPFKSEHMAQHLYPNYWFPIPDMYATDDGKEPTINGD